MVAAPRSFRVVVADDHALVRSGLVALLEAIKGVKVVGEADDGDQLPELVSTLQPDLVVTDISMARTNGLVALEELRRRFPDLAVLIISMHDNVAFVRRAMATGASGYLLKDAATVELQMALDAIRTGHVYMSPKVSSRLIASLRQDDAALGDPPMSQACSKGPEPGGAA